MGAVEKLDEAIERVQRGWVQGTLRQVGSDGHVDVCMVGGIVESEIAVRDYILVTRALAAVIAEQFPERCWGSGAASPGFSVSWFNDDDRTTKQEVLAVMEKARVRLMEVLD